MTTDVINGVPRELRSVLSMILSALDRDAAEGKTIRGEMAEELRALLTTAQPVSDDRYPPCDYCEKPLSYHPWHGSGVINGIESRHIHACDDCRDKLPKPVSDGGEREAFQSRVLPWLLECFGERIAGDTMERNHRFLEEALELVQACGCTADESHKLVDYVFGRDVGERSQEVGGVMTTLAALCLSQHLDMHEAAEVELTRITQPEMIERIREKQKRKPAMSPLPGVYPERAAPPAQASAWVAEGSRKVFICRDCDGVYSDEPVSQCDCMGREIYDEGYIVMLDGHHKH